LEDLRAISKNFMKSLFELPAWACQLYWHDGGGASQELVGNNQYIFSLGNFSSSLMIFIEK